MVVAVNDKATSGNYLADTSFLVQITTISHMVVFDLHAFELGERIAYQCRQRRTLCFMTIVDK